MSLLWSQLSAMEDVHTLFMAITMATIVYSLWLKCLLEIMNYACMRNALYAAFPDICVRRSSVNS